MKIRTTASIAPFRRSQLLARFLFSFVILAGSIFSLSADALAQSLTVGTDSALPGNDVDIAINFTAGATDISTIQLDLTFSGALSYVSTTTGSAASNAGKSASGSTIAGGVRVLVFGLNQNAVGSGAIAVVRLHIASGTAPGVLPISIGGISASDPLGNAVSLGGSSGSVTVNGTPDNTNPSITITSPTSGSSYTSSSASLNISGTASDNVGVTTVTWSNDRGGSGTASGTTNWSVSGISLQSGTNVITVTAKDAANNTGTDTLTVTYNPSDTINPSITITSPTSGSSYTSSSASLNISGTASDNVGVTTVTWSNNRGGSGTASGTTNWSVSGISLQSGTNVITVTAKDAANNTGTDTLTVTYNPSDTINPSITITSPTSGSSYTTGNNTITLDGTASDNVGVTTVTWSNNRGGSGTASGTTNWSVSGISLQSGTNVITVTAKDAANNTGTDTLTVTYGSSGDTTPPAITITSPTSGATYTASTGTITLDGLASDDVGVTSVTWVNDRGGSGTASGTTNWNISGISLQNGTNVITVTAKDAANNTGTDTLTVSYSGAGDTNPPSVTITSPTSASTYTSSGNSVSLDGHASDDVAVTQVTWANNRGGSGTASGTTNWNISGISLQNGTNIITVTAKDAANNTGTDTLTVSYAGSGDTTPPTILGVRSSNVSDSSAKISWVTDEPADTQVEYGPTASYGNSTGLHSTLSMLHSATVSGLKSDTLYHYRAKSTDGDGNVAYSADQTFTTATTPEDPVETQLTLSLPLPLTGFALGNGLAEEEFVGLAIANLAHSRATLKFTALDTAGETLTGPDISNPVTRVLEAGEQFPIIHSELFGSGLLNHTSLGWVRLESTVTQIAGFFLLFNSSLSVLDGGNLSSQTSKEFIFSEIEALGYTRLNISNQHPVAADVTFDLMNGSGTLRASVSRTIRPGGAVSEDVFGDLFPNRSAAASDYIRVTSTEGVHPFQLLSKPFQFVEGLYGHDVNHGSTQLYSPQYVVGGPWHSRLSVVNLDSVPGNVTLRFIRDDAVQIGSTRTLSIPAKGKLLVDDPNFFEFNPQSLGGEVVQGYIEIISSDVRMAGNVVFGDPEGISFSTALPLVSELQDSILFSHVASDDTFFTGLAILNPNTTDVLATVDLHGSDGRREATVTTIIPARQRKSQLLTEYFPHLVGESRSSGYVRVTTSQAVASFSLFGTKDLSVLSAVPPQELP